MSDTGRTDPFADVISMFAAPIAAVIRSFDQLRRGSEELMKGFENFNATMANLNATAERINRLLNDFEEPIRAMMPQVTRTIKMADELSTRLAVPVDQVVPGLTQLANTLNNPVLRRLPTDLGQFLETINEVGRRMSPLSQLAEQATSMFGFRLPGFGTPPARSTPAPVPAAAPAASPPAPARKRAAKSTPTRKRSPAKKAPARKR
jgi:ABC-type transporter Mla subunit MlaD